MGKMKKGWKLEMRNEGLLYLPSTMHKTKAEAEVARKALMKKYGFTNKKWIEAAKIKNADVLISDVVTWTIKEVR